MLKIIITILVFHFVSGYNSTDLKRHRFKRQGSSCGVNYKKGVGLIFGGEKFERGTWPWMVAMLNRQSKMDNKFFCSGTLVSSSKVVTGEKEIKTFFNDL